MGKDLIEALWWTDHGQTMVNADTFLPFGNEFTINKEIFLSNLPEKSAKKIRIASMWDFFPKGFQELLIKAGEKIGVEITIDEIERSLFYEMYQGTAPKEIMEKYDYRLQPYAASARYPAVQLRFLTGTGRIPPIDLKKAETPNLGLKEKEILIDYQKWLLKSQVAIPLYLYSIEMAYKDFLDVGDQPKTDAEIELWRVTKKSKAQND